ncbi:MAG: DGQHR domain-containing protein [Bacteriovoracaceae bacterium]|nr:DGQHR domain-containing protein [Bacteriovoracaceae bacterium]
MSTTKKATKKAASKKAASKKAAVKKTPAPVSGTLPFSVTKNQFKESTNTFHFSVSKITQNDKHFYTLSIPSDVLASTCFVTDRYTDPVEGFQRRLDKKKAQEIADYVNTGKAVIPTSVILSAQPEAEMWIDRRKTLVFQFNNKAFLVLDGQHRIYGYFLSNKKIDVPVVIFEGLSKSDEARLFIDINNKQTEVPPALLLDIKRLANDETDEQVLMGKVFDHFHSEMDSAMLGLLDPTGEDRSKINRMNFYRAFKPLLNGFVNKDKTPEEVYRLTNSFLKGLFRVKELGIKTKLKKSNYLYAFLNILPETVKEVVYRFDSNFTPDNFYNVLNPNLSTLKPSSLESLSGSGVKLKEYLLENIRSGVSW